MPPVGTLEWKLLTQKQRMTNEWMTDEYIYMFMNSHMYHENYYRPCVKMGKSNVLIGVSTCTPLELEFGPVTYS